MGFRQGTLGLGVQGAIDYLQFRLDVRFKWLYHPLPWMGIKAARRSEGTTARWKAVEELVKALDIRSAVDIGCHVGFFCLALADKGIPALGIDPDDRGIRIARYVAKRKHIDLAAFSNMRVSKRTVALIPNADAILVLSVWHHWVREFGLEAASELLSAIWKKTNKVLLFDTGQSEMTPNFHLPDMGPSPQDWLTRYLADICGGTSPQHLGSFKAFSPGGDEQSKAVQRSLFAVLRSGQSDVWHASPALTVITNPALTPGDGARH